MKIILDSYHTFTIREVWCDGEYEDCMFGVGDGPDRAAAFVRLRKAGVTPRIMAEKFGITRHIIGNILYEMFIEYKTLERATMKRGASTGIAKTAIKRCELAEFEKMPGSGFGEEFLSRKTDGIVARIKGGIAACTTLEEVADTVLRNMLRAVTDAYVDDKIMPEMRAMGLVEAKK